MKVTLDTNVLISGTFWSGDSHKILTMVDEKKLVSVLSKEIITEYYDVLKRDEIIEKIGDKALICSQVCQKVLQNSELVNVNEHTNVVTNDPDDNKILECAKAGNVDYVITNDNHILTLKEFEGIKIVTPKEFLEKIKQ